MQYQHTAPLRRPRTPAHPAQVRRTPVFHDARAEQLRDFRRTSRGENAVSRRL